MAGIRTVRVALNVYPNHLVQHMHQWQMEKDARLEELVEGNQVSLVRFLEPRYISRGSGVETLAMP